jgi:hypothetical protein
MKTLTLICLILISFLSFAQDTTFTKRYYTDASNLDGIISHGLVPNFENGVVICGELYSGKGIIMNTDSLGNYIWNRSLASPGSGVKIVDGLKTMDSSMLFSGYNYANDDMSSFFCLKMNFQGDTLWSRSFEMSKDVDEEKEFVGIEQLSDSSYVLIKSSPSDSLLKIIKLSPQGVNLWEKSIEGYPFEANSSFSDRNDTTFLIAGLINNTDGGIIKMSNAGEIIWSKRYNNKRIFDVLELENDTYALYDEDVWLMKLTENGNQIWLKEKEAYFVPFINFRPEYPALSKFNDTTLAISSNDYSSGYSRILTVDTTGATLNGLHVWGSSSYVEINEKKRVFISVNGPTYGIKAGIDREHVGLMTTNIQLDPDPSTCSETGLLSSSNTDTVIIDTMIFSISNSSDGINITYLLDSLILVKDDNCINYIGSLDKQDKINVKVYPNITSGKTHFDFSETGRFQIVITNLEGRIVKEHEVKGSSAVIDFSNFSSGVYLYKVVGNESAISGKIIKR